MAAPWTRSWMIVRDNEPTWMFIDLLLGKIVTN